MMYLQIQVPGETQHPRAFPKGASQRPSDTPRGTAQRDTGTAVTPRQHATRATRPS